MKNAKQEIEKLEKLINKEANKRSKIQNSNYILAMEIKAIREGKLNSVEDIVKWCFEMIRTGELVEGVVKGCGCGGSETL